MSAEIIGRRGLERLRDELSGRDFAIIRQIAELRLMSARQVEFIHFGLSDHASAMSAARCCRRALDRLVRARTLIRLDRRVGGVRAGSAGYVYALGPVGQRLLDVPGPRRRLREPVTYLALHTLAVTQLVVDLTVASRDGRLEIEQLQAEPSCWRATPNSAGSKDVLKPDLFVSIGVDELEYRWFVEVDRGNQSTPSLINKCLAYERYYRTGTEQADHDVFPRVIWLVPDKARSERLHDAIQADRHLINGLFVVTTADRAVEVMRGGRP